MKKLLIIFILFNVGLIAQPFQLQQRISELNSIPIDSLVLTKSANTYEDSFQVFVSDGTLPIILEPAIPPSGVTFEANQELYVYNIFADWEYVGDIDTVITLSDSSISISTIPDEINPDFDVWGYEYLLTSEGRFIYTSDNKILIVRKE